MKTLAILLIALVLCSGCATQREIHLELARRSVDTPRAGTMLTEIIGAGLVGIRNTAYLKLPGESANEVDMGALREVLLCTSGESSLVIMTTQTALEDVTAWLDQAGKSAQSLCMVSSEIIDTIRHRLPALPAQEIRISMLAVPFENGVIVSREERFDDGDLHLLVVNPIGANEIINSWYIRAVDFAAHELLHVQYSALGFWDRSVTKIRRTNEEAAARIFGFCAQVESHATLGFSSARLDLDERVKNGRQSADLSSPICPDKKAFDVFQGWYEQGQFVADIILGSIFPDGKVDSSNRENQRRLLRLCSELPSGIPDLTSGEIPAIQTAADCNRNEN